MGLYIFDQIIPFETQWLRVLLLPGSRTELEALRSPRCLFLAPGPAQCLAAGWWGWAGSVAVGWPAWWAAAEAGCWRLSAEWDWWVWERPSKAKQNKTNTHIHDYRNTHYRFPIQDESLACESQLSIWKVNCLGEAEERSPGTLTCLTVCAETRGTGVRTGVVLTTTGFAF